MFGTLCLRLTLRRKCRCAGIIGHTLNCRKRRRWVIRGKNGVSAHKHVSALGAHKASSFHTHAAIDLNERRHTRRVRHGRNRAHACIRTFDITLARKARFNAHHKHHVNHVNHAG
jgi:hypothetical protein